jgi:peptide/nickel transport system ATP-binding protein
MIENQYVLEVKNLVIHYETDEADVAAVNGVDLALEPRKTLGLVGETGAGKTSTALAFLGLVPDPPGVIRDGVIKVNGKEINKMSPKEMDNILGKEIAMIFQDPMTALNPVMTVGEQIAETIIRHERMGKKEAFQKAGEMLETVGIDKSRAGEYPHQFSGGMRQRVVIAIALACHPSILIADEPTTALDVTIQAQVLDLMKGLKQNYQTAMLLITHDLGVVAEICDEVAVMYAGKIVEKGSLQDVFEHTLHPYTEGLFTSLPNIKERVSRLVPIKGIMPDPSKLPKGCAFAPRCPYAFADCKKRQPKWHQLSKTHGVFCSAYDHTEFHINRR